VTLVGLYVRKGFGRVGATFMVAQGLVPVKITPMKGYTTNKNYAHEGLHYQFERSSGAIAPRYNREALLRYSN